uniref:F-box protein CPR30-like n=1 Tax=Fragaria vesca subsp. vesca TaxID=101020 RepID=UPI0005C8AAD0|nr:PREDICTED: F-box protein CPR30-like [Fragaria vesca subsp. vesca]
MSDKHIPEDIIVRIFSRLPVKSLFRFTCLSKRWCSIILSDSNFAKSHSKTAVEQQTRGFCRLLLYDRRRLSSSELKTPLFGDDSTVRKLSCPFRQRRGIFLLCSGNGLVCAVNFDDDDENFYIWNPSTGFFKQVPHHRVSASTPYGITYHGCGYLSATDDFKFLVAGKEKKEKKQVVEILSWRAQVWKAIEVPKDMFIECNGILLNEALHWLGVHVSGGDKVLFAFDLAKEEFRRMSMPILDEGDKLFDGITVSMGKCLCLYRFLEGSYFRKHFGEQNSCIDLWMMREYEVGDSWTKFCRLRFSNIPRHIYKLRPLLVMEDSTLVGKWTYKTDAEAIRVGYDGVVLETNVLMDSGCRSLEYEESLLRLDDYDKVSSCHKSKVRSNK